MEFFPIKDFDFLNKLIKNKNKLLLKPYFISITYGAFKSKFFNFNKVFFKNYKNIVPHVLCLNINIKKFKNIINLYYINNINKLLILKGDHNKYNENIYYSYNLINYIKKNYKKFFIIYAACYIEIHPKSFNFKNDIKNIIIKFNYKVNYFITQYFYNIDSYIYYYDDIKKIKKNFVSIIPGLMPLNKIEDLIRFSNICKSELHRWLLKRLNNKRINFNNIKKIGLFITVNLCLKLINFKIIKLHFYTMNNLNFINLILEKLLLNILI